MDPKLTADLSLIRAELSLGLCGCAYLTSAYPCGRCRRLEALQRVERALRETERERSALRGLIGRLRAASFYAMTAEEWDAAVDRVLGEAAA